MATNKCVRGSNGFWVWCLVLILGVTAAIQPARADDTAQPSDVSPATIDAAQTQMLQRKVSEQQRDIASLRAEVVALKAQLKSMGLKPVTDATTQPVTVGKAKRIIFIYATTQQEIDAEIHKSVGALDVDQWFNVYTLYDTRAFPYKSEFVQATQANKKKFDSDFHPGFMIGTLLPGVANAAKLNPDVIWVVGAPIAKLEEETFMSELRRLAPGFRGRIDTAADFMHANVYDLHFMWRLSHETGGVCVIRMGTRWMSRRCRLRNRWGRLGRS